MCKFRENILIDEEVYCENILVLSNEEVSMIIGLTLINQALISIDSSVVNVCSSKEDNSELNVINQPMVIKIGENLWEVRSDGQKCVEDMIEQYCPAECVNRPIKMKIVLLKDIPIYHRPWLQVYHVVVDKSCELSADTDVNQIGWKQAW